jgi:hypothetical protein
MELEYIFFVAWREDLFTGTPISVEPRVRYKVRNMAFVLQPSGVNYPDVKSGNFIINATTIIERHCYGDRTDSRKVIIKASGRVLS